jgi:hypothetical protein
MVAENNAVKDNLKLWGSWKLEKQLSMGEAMGWVA